MKAAALMTALLLAGCGAAGDAGAEASATQEPGATRAIRGEWRLETVNDRLATNQEPVLLTIGDTIVLKAGCVEQEWSYTLGGDALRTRSEGRMSCLRGLTRDEKALGDVIMAGATIMPGGDERLELRSAAGKVELVPASSAWTQPEIPAGVGTPTPPPPPPGGDIAPPPPPPQPTLRGDWRLAGNATTLHFGRDRIEFDNCQQVAWRYTYNAPRLTTERTPAVTIDIAPKPQPCAAPFAPPVGDMVTAIDMAERIERTRDGIVVLGPGNVRVRLVRP